MGPALPAAMSDPLPTSIPCLKPNGSNWAIFSMHFQEAMEANQKWGHFDGTTPCPAPADANTPTDAELKVVVNWNQDETVAKYLLSQRLPNSTAVHLQALVSAKQCWDKVKTEFSMKSQYTEMDLLTAFSKMRCPRRGDVCTFLGQMHVKCEELAAVGVTMTEKEYHSAIIKAIPDEMSKFASGLLTATRVLSPTTSIDPDILINHISEEADHLVARCKCDGGSSGKGKQSQSQDEAMAATHWDGGKKRRKGKCHNCGKLGHWACECWSPKKEQSNQSSGQSSQPLTYQNATKPENKPVGLANVVAVPEDDASTEGWTSVKPDGCWLAVFFGDVLELPETEVVTPRKCEEAGASAASSGRLAAAAITQIEVARPTHVELYNSGATCHISLYCDDFTTYCSLKHLVFLNVANGQQFPAVGTGSMVISAPNRDSQSELTLENVLHAPSVGYMLVLLGALDSLGYCIVISNGNLEI